MLIKKRLPTLLVSFIGSVPLYSHQALANLTEKSLLGETTYTKTLSIINSNKDSLKVCIQAKKASVYYPGCMFFIGEVTVKQGNNTLDADKVQLKQYKDYLNIPIRTITAVGNVNYFNNAIKLEGQKAWSNLNTKDTDVYFGTYQIVGQQGRGKADTIKQRSNNRYTLLENGSFTSCLPGDNSWNIVGSNVLYDRKKQIAKIWNAYFKIGKLPIFYCPYLQIPVGDKRRSGILIPNAKYCRKSGFEFNVPYYLNLATNYDATMIPNFISKRGNQIQTEFRYLTTLGKGLLEFDILPKDRFYKINHLDKGDSDRWLLYWRHNALLDREWRFNVDYTKISDFNYFDDLDSKYGGTTDGCIMQKFSFGYTNDNWDTALILKQFQVFDANNKKNYAYQATPQIEIMYYKNNIDPFDFKIFSQVIKFTTINNSYPEATRLHFEPTLDLLLINRWGSLHPEIKLIATHYQQKNVDKYNTTVDTSCHLKDSVNRMLPQFKTDGKMVLERNINYASKYTQTLEPHLQYLYVPYRNQKKIGLYDSTPLQKDYSSLFRDRTYSGLDRIASANQLAVGVTTRIYDNQSIEQFNASLGQVYYFSRLRTDSNIMSTNSNKHNNTGSIIWAGDAYSRISNHSGIRGNLLYNSLLKSVTLGNIAIEYWHDKNRILQLNYRYASLQYIKHILFDVGYYNYYKGISQVGITGNWSLIDRWSIAGACYYDGKVSQISDELLGLQYNTCCWAINIGYERKIIGWNNTENFSRYDNKLLFNIALRGLNNNPGISIDRILSSNILPYQSAL